MKALSLVLVFTCSSIFAMDAEINEGVWIDGSSFYKSIKHRKRSTIYFSNWSGYIDEFLKDEDYYVALQLNESFDPIPKDDVQVLSLNTITAISDYNLRIDYYGFLESYGRTNGVNHLVLPDTVGLLPLEKEIIGEINQHSPFYFLNKSSLSYSLPNSKKEFEDEAIDRPTIWIAEQNRNTSKLKKWSNKLVPENIATFYDELKKSKSTQFIPAYEMPLSLSKTIFSSSVVAIDPEEVFPLSDQLITYLGMDRQLKQRLRQYVQVLDYRVPGVPCIVDRRRNEGILEKGDIAIQIGISEDLETGISLPELVIPNVDALIAKMLFGSLGMIGRSDHPDARTIENLHYLGYADPETEELNPHHLTWIDSIAADAIKRFATPGIQLAVVKNGSIIVEKAYGHFTYDSLRAVSNHTVYDIASVTKVMATLPAIALLIDQRKINLDDSLAMHLDEFKSSNKSAITIRQLLSHNAGLKSYVPFWSMMMDGDRLDAFYYKTPEDESKDIRTYGLEPHPSMADSLKSFIVRSKLIENPEEYRYSDLGFMILHLLVEQVSGLSFEEFLKTNFYQPMGLSNTTFNPIQKGISPKDITPTEYDNRYRSYQVWGEVHDRNALVFGGVAGHAGLFSNAKDLAKMMYMFMNDGFYGGRHYLSKATIEQLNERYFKNNRRGLGWDKKDGKKDSASSLASDRSYGHTGFTGTMVWADPEADLIYVFLSNRIYPDANNWKLMELNTRTHIHDVLYQSLENYK
ncbi:serine hydrolase domain-containing protein [Ekhidna sp. To15]|uniref:serine hydrolase domain-containing protein n=1 Tax=Ekhidna sp. To15 TaxID=3395267 RepID=UPI003F520037